MKLYKTLLGIDPLYEKKLGDLAELVVAAGGVQRLAAILGINPKTVDQWGRSGQISPRGAALVHSSEELNPYYTAEYLRPDVEPRRWRRIFQSKSFTNALEKQKRYELEHGGDRDAESPIFIVLKLKKRVDDEKTNDDRS